MSKNLFEFTNAQPSQYDGLGEIPWVGIKECSTCLKEVEPVLRSQIYDGLHFQMPECPLCGKPILGVPKNMSEREIFIQKIPERAPLAAMIKEIEEGCHETSQS